MKNYNKSSIEKIYTILLCILFFVPTAASAFTVDPDGTIHTSTVDPQYFIYGQTNTGNGNCSSPYSPYNPPDGPWSNSSTYQLDFAEGNGLNVLTNNNWDPALLCYPKNTSLSNSPWTIVEFAGALGQCWQNTEPDTLSDCENESGFTMAVVFYPAQPPPPTISEAVGIATSSFATTFGFDMDEVSSWMWDNLGQPILGSGIGVLVVMRWFWLGLIAIGIIIFFCFAYFKFFKR